jgi:hypothetical protein
VAALKSIRSVQFPGKLCFIGKLVGNLLKPDIYHLQYIADRYAFRSVAIETAKVKQMADRVLRNDLSGPVSPHRSLLWHSENATRANTELPTKKPLQQRPNGNLACNRKYIPAIDPAAARNSPPSRNEFFGQSSPVWSLDRQHLGAIDFDLGHFDFGLFGRTGKPAFNPISQASEAKQSDLFHHLGQRFQLSSTGQQAGGVGQPISLGPDPPRNTAVVVFSALRPNTKLDTYGID